MTERILVVLVNLSLQFILVFIVAQLMVTVFRIRSASARYAVWLVVVLCPLVLIPMNIVSSDIVIFGSNNFDWNRAINFEQMPDNVLNLSSGNATTETQSIDSVTPTQTEPEIPLYMQFLNNILINLPLILVGVWLIGVSWCFIRLGSGYFRLIKLLSKAYEVRDKGMLELFDDVRNTIKLSRPVRLFSSSEVSVPISIGIIHPYIILPDNMLTFYSRGEAFDSKNISNIQRSQGKCFALKMILIHEMAHLKRFDYLINMICQIIRSFMFFHPIFHLSVRRFELAIEQNCDGWAIGLTGTDMDYAEFLLSLSRANMGRYPVCSAMDGSSLKERVRAILEKKEAFKKMGKRSMVSLLVAILSVVFIVSIVRLADTAPAEGGKIAFSKVLGANWQIVVTDENGQNLINLSNNNADDWSPTWSPDGKYIAYTSNRDGNAEIYIMDADGSNQRRITNNSLFDSYTSFAPDGRSLIFTRTPKDASGVLDAPSAKVFTVDIDGKHERFLINGWAAKWSPDGKKVAFCKKSGQWGINLMDADGRNQEDISGSLNDFDPSWSLDGKQIVFSSQRRKLGLTNIYKMDSNGQNVVCLTQADEQDCASIWSPDGQYIAFTILMQNFGILKPTRIVVMKADGNEPKVIAENASDPSWFDLAFAKKYAVNPLSKISTLWGKLKEK